MKPTRVALSLSPVIFAGLCLAAALTAFTPYAYADSVSISAKAWEGIAPGDQLSSVKMPLTVTEGNGTNYHGVDLYLTVPAHQSWQFSVDIQPSTTTVRPVELYVMDQNDESGGVVTGICTPSGAGSTGGVRSGADASGAAISITPLSGGWYTCTLSGSISTTPQYLRLVAELYDGSAYYNGDGASGANLRNASLAFTDAVAPPAPVITSFSQGSAQNPASAGARIAISGSGFVQGAGGNDVLFNGRGEVTATYGDANDITFSVSTPFPDGTSAGTYQLSVQNVNGTSNALPFVVSSTATTACTLSASPASITSGQNTTLTLSWTPGQQFHGAIQGTAESNNPGIATFAPTQTTTYTGTIYQGSVSSGTPVATCSATVTVSPPGTTPPPAAPTVSSIAPSPLTPGGSATITGSGFQSTDTVRLTNQPNSLAAVVIGFLADLFGGAQSTVIPATSSDGSTINFVVPSTVTPASYTLTVTTSGGTSAGKSVTVKAATTTNPPPTESSLSPNSVAAGASVTIAGSGFLPGSGNDVLFNGRGEVNGIYIDASHLQFVVSAPFPDGTSAGTYQVSVENANGTSNSLPLVVTNAPVAACTLTASPSTTTPGEDSTLTLSWTGLGTQAYGVITGAYSHTVTNGGSTTASPAVTKTFQGSVYKNNGTLATQCATTITVVPPAPSAPAITSVSPTSIPAGNSVLISGSGFTTSSNSVLLNSTTIGTAASSNGKTLSITVPPAQAPGAYSLTVQNANGTSNAVSFTIAAPSSITCTLTANPSTIKAGTDSALTLTWTPNSGLSGAIVGTNVHFVPDGGSTPASPPITTTYQGKIYKGPVSPSAVVATCQATVSVTSTTPPPPPPPPNAPSVSISGKTLVGSDGKPLMIKGVIVRPVLAPVPDDQPGVISNFGPAELAAAKSWGANTIRILTSQGALDPQGPLYGNDSQYIARIASVAQQILNAGFILDIGVNWESTTSGGTGVSAAYSAANCMPTAATERAWQTLISQVPVLTDARYAHQVMLEPFNEPTATGFNDAAAWQLWQNGGAMPAGDRCSATATVGMNALIQELRNAGAQNIIIADGLGWAHFLNPSYPLTDPLGQLAYAAHPFLEDYAPYNQLNGNPANDDPILDAAFGDMTSVAPVLATAFGGGGGGGSSGSGCQPNAPVIMPTLLNYLGQHNMGAIGFSFDDPRSGVSLTTDWNWTPSSYTNFSCGANGGRGQGGMGQLLLQWFLSGTTPPAATPTVNSLSPTSVVAGAQETITGTGFLASNTVSLALAHTAVRNGGVIVALEGYFGDLLGLNWGNLAGDSSGLAAAIVALAPSTTQISATITAPSSDGKTIVFTVPSSLAAGSYTLTVSNTNGTSAGAALSVTSPVTQLPTISVTTSSSASGYPASNILDGNAATAWIASLKSSDANNFAWVQFDLGQERYVNSISWQSVTAPYPASAVQSYVIKVSDDGSNWTPVYAHFASSTDPLNLATGPLALNANARYVRVESSKVNDGTGSAASMSNVQFNTSAPVANTAFTCTKTLSSTDDYVTYLNNLRGVSGTWTNVCFNPGTYTKPVQMDDSQFVRLLAPQGGVTFSSSVADYTLTGSGCTRTSDKTCVSSDPLFPGPFQIQNANQIYIQGIHFVNTYTFFDGDCSHDSTSVCWSPKALWQITDTASEVSNAFELDSSTNITFNNDTFVGSGKDVVSINSSNPVLLLNSQPSGYYFELENSLSSMYVYESTLSSNNQSSQEQGSNDYHSVMVAWDADYTIDNTTINTQSGRDMFTGASDPRGASNVNRIVVVGNTTLNSTIASTPQSWGELSPNLYNQHIFVTGTYPSALVPFTFDTNANGGVGKNSGTYVCFYPGTSPTTESCDYPPAGE